MSTAPKDLRRPYRVAVRAEGAFVNAYWAQTETMEGAILLCTMRKTVMELPGIWDSFQSLMGEVGRGLIESVAGLHVEGIETRDAPEHERAGHG